MRLQNNFYQTERSGVRQTLPKPKRSGSSYPLGGLPPKAQKPLSWSLSFRHADSNICISLRHISTWKTSKQLLSNVAYVRYCTYAPFDRNCFEVFHGEWRRRERRVHMLESAWQTEIVDRNKGFQAFGGNPPKGLEPLRLGFGRVCLTLLLSVR